MAASATVTCDDRPAMNDEQTSATDVPVIELVQPMPGFPDASRFALVQLDDDGILCALTSLDVDGLRFLVVPPTPFFPDYAPEVDDDVATRLGLSRAEDALVLLVLTAGETLATSTANLVAPLVVNRSTRQAAQVVLADQDLPLAAPLVA